MSTRGKKFVLLVIPTLENAYHHLREFAAVTIPMGLISMAAVLEREGYEVELIDGDAENLSFTETLSRTLSARPNFVGSTTMTATMDLTTNFYRALKGKMPQVQVFLGGPHVSALPARTLEECPAIDYGVIGEGEDTLVELMKALEEHQDLSPVQGIAFRSQGRVQVTAPRSWIEDLGRLPLPAYHLLKYSLYQSYGWNRWVSGRRGPLGVVFTGRGCFGRCNFCATKVVLGRRIRYFPVTLIQDQIDLLMERYRIRVLYFQDDIFTADPRRVGEICDFLLSRGYSEKLEIMVSSRVDTVRPEVLRQMRRAGVRWICFGVESGNQQILDRMGKRIAIAQIREAFGAARAAGLYVAGNYMIGHLGETEETAWDTIRLACELDQDYVSFAVAIPLPGTELYQHCLDQGIPLPGWGDFGSVNSPPIPLNKELPPERLVELRRLATSRFFKRPLYLLRLLGRFRPQTVASDFLKMYLALKREEQAGRY